jgi:collagen type VI alpha
MLTTATLFSLVAGAAAGGACAPAPDCTTCLAITTAKCGWCAVNTTTSTSVGPRCADLTDSFDCNIQFQTDKCNAKGWTCKMGANGGNESQCVPSVGGISDKATCEEQCKKPPPPPPPSKGVAKCDFPADNKTAPTCKACNGTAGDCHYKSSGDCTKDCAWKYMCDRSTLTCKQAKFGAKSKSDCESGCKTLFNCDFAKKQCTAVNSTGPGKTPYKDNATCSAECGHPTPVPYELRGIWRGIQQQKTYETGEWLANITENFMEMWKPVQGSAEYQLYVKGPAVGYKKEATSVQYVIEVSSTAGLHKGQTRFIAHDYSMDPETFGYVNLALDEEQEAITLADFDTAMVSPTATVLGLEKCPNGTVGPKPPPPHPPPPPACHAKLDVVIILDGSASIVAPDWQKALAFTNEIVDSFVIGADDSEIGVTQFSDTTADVIELSADKAAIKKAVSATSQMKRNTNTGAGFSAADKMLTAHGRPKTNGKLVILITDGKANRGVSPKTVADAMKAKGIEIFGIGVGSAVDKAALESWVTTPSATHYFSADSFSALDKVLQELIKNACKHPPSAPPFGLAAGLGATGSKMCKFHFPSGLPDKLQLINNRRAPVFDLPAPVAAVENGFTPAVVEDPIVTDPCNTFTTCQKCIAARDSTSGKKTCGWCTGDITYQGKPSIAKCAGKDGSASQWTCSKHFQTTSCDEPVDCGLKGVYRGLRIDNTYDIGEWGATFTPDGTTKSTATFEFLDPAKGATDKVSGTLQCAKPCSEGNNQAGVTFTLTTTTGTILHGICGYTGQQQAETNGLMWAISDAGVADPPATFDAAMPGTNATVFTYYKCLSWKPDGTCLFKALP